MGRHADKYHRYMLTEVGRIDTIAKGNQAIFLSEFEGVKAIVRQNPAMMYKAHWL